MPRFKIPENQIPSIQKLIDLPQKTVNDIYAFLAQQKDGTGYSKFTSEFEKEFSEKELGETVYSLGQLVTYTDVTKDEIVKDLIESLSEDEDILLDDEQSGILSDRFYNILHLSDFSTISFKAYRSVEEVNSTVRTDITTDIRIIFGGTDYTKRNALLLHKLLIKFTKKDAEQSKSDVYHLDKEDLIKLKSQIESAIDADEEIRKQNDDTFNFIEL